MLNQVRKLDSDFASRLHEAVVLKNAGFFIAEGLLFIPVPEWEGWKYINCEKNESAHHFARWEFFFYPKCKPLWIFLRITWPSVTQILLGFVYPDDRKLLEEIVLHRRLVLLDQPLLNGQVNPLSSGIIVDDIPTDLPKIFGIGFGYGRSAIQ